MKELEWKVKTREVLVKREAQQFEFSKESQVRGVVFACYLSCISFRALCDHMRVNSLLVIRCVSRFLGSAQKPPGGHACAARRFISLCVELVSDGLNRLAGMNIRQAVQQCCVFLLVCVWCRLYDTVSDIISCFSWYVEVFFRMVCWIYCSM